MTLSRTPGLGTLRGKMYGDELQSIDQATGSSEGIPLSV